MKRNLTLKRDTYDARDLKVSYSGPLNLPTYYSLEEWTPSVADQGDLGACTAFTAVEMLELLIKKYWQWVKDKSVPADKLQLSQLFQYYNERLMEGDVSQDAGADSRTMCKAVVEYGIPLESLWPYDVSKFAAAPPQDAYKAAGAYKPGAYHRVVDVATAKSVIYSGYPVSIGVSLYTSFWNDAVSKTGVVPLPQPGDQLEGGHEMWLFAYDDTKVATEPDGTVRKGYFKTRNHWGKDWGEGGNCWMPYDYLANPALGMDMWTFHLGKPWK